MRIYKKEHIKVFVAMSRGGNFGSSFAWIANKYPGEEVCLWGQMGKSKHCFSKFLAWNFALKVSFRIFLEALKDANRFSTSFK